MPPRSSLTPEQRAAACSPEPRLLVVASPGCGKTTIAAERFGFHRYDPKGDPRRCLALSFTRAATAELQRRIRGRWGPSALSWPHRAMTLDALHVDLVEWLLRSGSVQWPNGHTSLTVEDSWRGWKGVRRLTDGQYAARPALRDGAVQARSVRHRGIPITRIGKVGDLREHFDEGRCSHLEARELLGLALQDAGLRAALCDELRHTTRAIVVDEVFDGNEVDLGVVGLAADAGISVSLIGDPWQAVYEFRGADPVSTDRQLQDAGFGRVNVQESFRFRTDHMRARATLLRSRAPCALPAEVAEKCDVVLASEWETLWGCDSVVLPLSFGTVRNQTDAALLVLLDHVTMRRFGRPAVYVSDAHATVSDLLAPGGPTADVLDRWRSELRRIGSPAQLRRLDPESEADRVEKLQLLAERLVSPRSVPGMTVHQAKGGEWPRVGLRLNDDEANRLAVGLDPRLEADRVVYVAGTRAMDDLWLVS
jgi:DNA helicase II / ATP-dependent DNA helicase PcrA